MPISECHLRELLQNQNCELPASWSRMNSGSVHAPTATRHRPGFPTRCITFRDQIPPTTNGNDSRERVIIAQQVGTRTCKLDSIQKVSWKNANASMWENEDLLRRRLFSDRSPLRPNLDATRRMPQFQELRTFRRGTITLKNEFRTSTTSREDGRVSVNRAEAMKLNLRNYRSPFCCYQESFFYYRFKFSAKRLLFLSFWYLIDFLNVRLNVPLKFHPTSAHKHRGVYCILNEIKDLSTK